MLFYILPNHATINVFTGFFFSLNIPTNLARLLLCLMYKKPGKHIQEWKLPPDTNCLFLSGIDLVEVFLHPDLC